MPRPRSTSHPAQRSHAPAPANQASRTEVVAFVAAIVAVLIGADVLSGSAMSQQLFGALVQRGGGARTTPAVGARSPAVRSVTGMISAGSRAPGLRQAPPSQPSANPCTTLQPGTPVGLEYFETYTLPIDDFTTPYKEEVPLGPVTGDDPMIDHLWYAQTATSQSIWHEPTSGQSWSEPLVTLPTRRPVLTGLRVGDSFGIVAAAWPGRGVWTEGAPTPDGHRQGIYRLSEVPGASSCPNFFLVYRYDPEVVSVDRALAGMGAASLAWWRPGEIAFSVSRFPFCSGHCDPRDAAAYPVVWMSAHLVQDPGVTPFRPLTLTILHRGLVLQQPETSEGNSLTTRTFVDGASGVRWRLHRALDVYGDATNPAGVLPAALVPSSATLLDAVEPVIRGRSSGVGRDVTLSHIRGFVADPATQEFRLIDVMDQDRGLSVMNLFVPYSHLVAQHEGTEQLAQNTVGVLFAPRLHAAVVEAPGWPQRTGYDLTTSPEVFPTPEDGPVAPVSLGGAGGSSGTRASGLATIDWDVVVNGQLPSIRGALVETGGELLPLLSLYQVISHVESWSGDGTPALPAGFTLTALP